MGKRKKTYRFGVVGAGGRGGRFQAGIHAAGGQIAAVCDINPESLDKAAGELGASRKYTDYLQMLDEADLDAVIVGTPMPLHAKQSIAALKRDIHVLCEVPAAVSPREAKQLVAAAKQSKAVYMMAENYCYMRHTSLMRHMALKGLFGQIYYAEGEYLHELKELNEVTTWRRKWQTGVAGVTYGTHSLGPILQCLPGDRVVRVCCEDTSFRHTDPRGDEYAQTTPVMLCKTAKGVLIKIRVDMLSDRPDAMTNYQLQGTDGAYESSRGGPVDHGKFWLRSLNEKMEWVDENSLWKMKGVSQKYLPAEWVRPSKEATSAGHGGGDYFQMLDFVHAIEGHPCPLDVHRSLDITLPGLLSQKSIIQKGRWLEVPDSREW
ncbi:MAG: Gfo/Idh/MocA family oxidoreductase [Phycisphaerae bacterium]|nr:Gfo/Idh/MocA family oxidoreductase [Phycisphaerae bacterium]